MEELKKEFKELQEKKTNIDSRISELENSEVLKEFRRLVNEERGLAWRLKAIDKQIKEKEYSQCSHIWVESFIEFEYDIFDRWCPSDSVYRCIKCGKQVEGTLMGEHGIAVNDSLGICYDLARAIYLKIKEAHPDIDDLTMRKYFEVAADDIRYIKVSDKRKRERAQRLSLDPSFCDCDKSWLYADNNDFSGWLDNYGERELYKFRRYRKGKVRYITTYDDWNKKR